MLSRPIQIAETKRMQKKKQAQKGAEKPSENQNQFDDEPAFRSSTKDSSEGEEDNCHDRDFFGVDEITLHREGITKPLFNRKVFDKIKNRLTKRVQNIIEEYGFFSYRPRERLAINIDEDSLEIKEIEDFDDDGTYYYGQWHPATEKLEGRGILIYSDGSMYDGLFHLSKKHSAGRIVYSNGDVFQGEWDYETIEGYGTLKSNERPSMKGEWKNGQIHGQAYQEYDDYTYRGECVKGKRKGKGVLVKRESWTYTGDFKDNHIHGEGKLDQIDGRTYKGQFQNNLMHGKGHFSWPKGDIYEGDYVNDEKEGYGIFKYEDGSEYKGEFKNGMPNGYGKFTSKEGKIKRGQWID